MKIDLYTKKVSNSSIYFKYQITPTVWQWVTQIIIKFYFNESNARQHLLY